jgi:hypothetical protein
VDEAEIFLRYERMLNENPQLRNLGLSSREATEAARAEEAKKTAAAKRASLAEAKRMEAEGRRISRQIFIPHYGTSELCELSRIPLLPEQLKVKFGIDWAVIPSDFMM